MIVERGDGLAVMSKHGQNVPAASVCMRIDARVSDQPLSTQMSQEGDIVAQNC